MRKKSTGAALFSRKLFRACSCEPNSERAECRVNGCDRAHERGRANDRGGGCGHAHESAHVHEHVPCCDRGGASCRLRGHATH